eukprot:COSAG01_NODE_2312_length_7938_cov_4.108687_11_plen_429_part_00
MTSAVSEAIQCTAERLTTSTECIFVTGKAGTGKSTLLREFRRLSQKKIVVLAPTGVSALNVQGETLHSFFKFKINISTEMAQQKGSRLKRTQFYEQIDCIVIDEVSMLRADLLSCMDVFLKAVLKSELPFGGKQVIFFGDLYQLPPVVHSSEQDFYASQYDSPYFFSAPVMQALDLKLLELNKIYRQQDPDFIDCLNALRSGQLNEAQCAALNMAVQQQGQTDCRDSIYLCSTNAAAQRRNQHALAQLSSPIQSFHAQQSGKFEQRKGPNEKCLDLKLGAKVMFLNNDSQDRWVNGSLGEVINLSAADLCVTVRLQNGQIVETGPYTWDMFAYRYDDEAKKYCQEKVGDYTQVPLSLAWAMTIHKSQGKSFDKVTIDLAGGAFASGQVYVGISRCRSLGGLTLKQALHSKQMRPATKIDSWLATLANY